MFTLEGHIERDYISQILIYTYVHIHFTYSRNHLHSEKVARAPMIHRQFLQT